MTEQLIAPQNVPELPIDSWEILESVHNPQELREEKLFAPAEQSDNELDDYDSLFTSKDEIIGSIKAAEVRTGPRETVTEQKSKHAEARLNEAINTDPRLGEIFSSYANRSGITDRAKLVESVRLDKQLRLDVGRYFLYKTDRLASLMPERIRRNSEKSPSTLGYSHIPGLTSREYASLLAISMLDGTFDDERSKSDSVHINKSTGEVLLGQHRSAAEVLITTA